MLTEMEAGKTYDEALAEAQDARLRRGRPDRRRLGRRRGGEDGDPRDGRVQLALSSSPTSRSSASTGSTPLDVAAARELEMVIRLVGAARLVDGQVDVRVGPALVDRHHPLAAVEGAFNAVMLQGDAIREITLEGPGAGGIETASAVIADMASVIGTMGTGFLQNDAVWRSLPRLPPGEHRSPFYFHLSVDDRPGVLARVADGAGRARDLDRAARSSTRTATAPRCTSSRTRRARARSTTRSRRSRALRRGAHAAAAVPRRLRPWRRGARMGVIERYADRLPVGPDTPRLTLGEGCDAARPLARGSPRRSASSCYFKFEGMNPTGSFKDRGMVRRRREGGRGRVRGDRLRVDRQHRRLGRRVRGARRPDRRRADARRARSRPRSRRSRARSARRCSRSAAASTTRCAAASSSPTAARSCSSTRSTRTGSRARRRPRSRSSRSSAARRTCSRCPTAAAATRVAYAKGFAEEGAATRLVSAQAAERAATLRLGDPHRRAGAPRRGRRARRRRPRRDRHGRRRGDHGRVARDREPGGRLLRAVVGRRLRGARARRARARQHRRLRPHRPRPEGHGRGRRPGRGDHVVEPNARRDPRRGSAVTHPSSVAPATTANLGPGFDCAAAALDLWNELEVTSRRAASRRRARGRGRRRAAADAEHLALRAFALVAPVEGYSFRFVNRIPLERGLGSCAATIAARPRRRRSRSPGRDASPDELLDARAAARGPRRQPRRRAASAASA